MGKIKLGILKIPSNKRFINLHVQGLNTFLSSIPGAKFDITGVQDDGSNIPKVTGTIELNDDIESLSRLYDGITTQGLEAYLILPKLQYSTHLLNLDQKISIQLKDLATKIENQKTQNIDFNQKTTNLHQKYIQNLERIYEEYDSSFRDWRENLPELLQDTTLMTLKLLNSLEKEANQLKEQFSTIDGLMVSNQNFQKLSQLQNQFAWSLNTIKEGQFNVRERLQNGSIQTNDEAQKLEDAYLNSLRHQYDQIQQKIGRLEERYDQLGQQIDHLEVERIEDLQRVITELTNLQRDINQTYAPLIIPALLFKNLSDYQKADNEILKHLSEQIISTQQALESLDATTEIYKYLNHHLKDLIRRKETVHEAAKTLSDNLNQLNVSDSQFEHKIRMLLAQRANINISYPIEDVSYQYSAIFKQLSDSQQVDDKILNQLSEQISSAKNVLKELDKTTVTYARLNAHLDDLVERKTSIKQAAKTFKNALKKIDFADPQIEQSMREILTQRAEFNTGYSTQDLSSRYRLMGKAEISARQTLKKAEENLSQLTAAQQELSSVKSPTIANVQTLQKRFFEREIKKTQLHIDALKGYLEQIEHTSDLARLTKSIQEKTTAFNNLTLPTWATAAQFKDLADAQIKAQAKHLEVKDIIKNLKETIASLSEDSLNEMNQGLIHSLNNSLPGLIKLEKDIQYDLNLISSLKPEQVAEMAYRLTAYSHQIPKSVTYAVKPYQVLVKNEKEALQSRFNFEQSKAHLFEKIEQLAQMESEMVAGAGKARAKEYIASLKEKLNIEAPDLDRIAFNKIMQSSNSPTKKATQLPSLFKAQIEELSRVQDEVSSISNALIAPESFLKLNQAYLDTQENLKNARANQMSIVLRIASMQALLDSRKPGAKILLQNELRSLQQVRDEYSQSIELLEERIVQINDFNLINPISNLSKNKVSLPIVPEEKSAVFEKMNQAEADAIKKLNEAKAVQDGLNQAIETLTALEKSEAIGKQLVDEKKKALNTSLNSVTKLIEELQQTLEKIPTTSFKELTQLTEKLNEVTLKKLPQKEESTYEEVTLSSLTTLAGTEIDISQNIEKAHTQLKTLESDIIRISSLLKTKVHQPQTNRLQNEYLAELRQVKSQLQEKRSILDRNLKIFQSKAAGNQPLLQMPDLPIDIELPKKIINEHFEAFDSAQIKFDTTLKSMEDKLQELLDAKGKLIDNSFPKGSLSEQFVKDKLSALDKSIGEVEAYIAQLTESHTQPSLSNMMAKTAALNELISKVPVSLEATDDIEIYLDIAEKEKSAIASRTALKEADISPHIQKVKENFNNFKGLTQALVTQYTKTILLQQQEISDPMHQQPVLEGTATLKEKVKHAIMGLEEEIQENTRVKNALNAIPQITNTGIFSTIDREYQKIQKALQAAKNNASSLQSEIEVLERKRGLLPVSFTSSSLESLNELNTQITSKIEGLRAQFTQKIELLNSEKGANAENISVLEQRLGTLNSLKESDSLVDALNEFKKTSIADVPLRTHQDYFNSDAQLSQFNQSIESANKLLNHAATTIKGMQSYQASIQELIETTEDATLKILLNQHNRATLQGIEGAQNNIKAFAQRILENVSGTSGTNMVAKTQKIENASLNFKSPEALQNELDNLRQFGEALVRVRAQFEAEKASIRNLKSKDWSGPSVDEIIANQYHAHQQRHLTHFSENALKDITQQETQFEKDIQALSQSTQFSFSDKLKQLNEKLNKTKPKSAVYTPDNTLNASFIELNALRQRLETIKILLKSKQENNLDEVNEFLKQAHTNYEKENTATEALFNITFSKPSILTLGAIRELIDQYRATIKAAGQTLDVYEKTPELNHAQSIMNTRLGQVRGVVDGIQRTMASLPQFDEKSGSFTLAQKYKVALEERLSAAQAQILKFQESGPKTETIEKAIIRLDRLNTIPLIVMPENLNSQLAAFHEVYKKAKDNDEKARVVTLDAGATAEELRQLRQAKQAIEARKALAFAKMATILANETILKSSELSELEGLYRSYSDAAENLLAVSERVNASLKVRKPYTQSGDKMPTYVERLKNVQDILSRFGAVAVAENDESRPNVSAIMTAIIDLRDALFSVDESLLQKADHGETNAAIGALTAAESLAIKLIKLARTTDNEKVKQVYSALESEDKASNDQNSLFKKATGSSTSAVIDNDALNTAYRSAQEKHTAYLEALDAAIEVNQAARNGMEPAIEALMSARETELGRLRQAAVELYEALPQIDSLDTKDLVDSATAAFTAFAEAVPILTNEIDYTELNTAYKGAQEKHTAYLQALDAAIEVNQAARNGMEPDIEALMSARETELGRLRQAAVELYEALPQIDSLDTKDLVDSATAAFTAFAEAVPILTNEIDYTELNTAYKGAQEKHTAYLQALDAAIEVNQAARNGMEPDIEALMSARETELGRLRQAAVELYEALPQIDSLDTKDLVDSATAAFTAFAEAVPILTNEIDYTELNTAYKGAQEKHTAYLQALDAAIEVNQAARNGMEPDIEALMSARETELGRLRQAAVELYEALPQIDSLDTKDLVDSATAAFTAFAEAVPILTNEIDYTELNTAYKGAQEKHTAYLQALDAAIEVNQAARNGMEPDIEALMSARETELGRLRQAAVELYEALPQIDSLDTKDLVDSATAAFTAFAEAVPILTNEIDYTELNTAYKGAQEKHTAYLQALDAAIEVNQAARNGMEPAIEALMSARETELGRLRQAAVELYEALPQIDSLDTKDLVDSATSAFTTFAEAVPILTNEIDYTELNTAYKGAQEKHTAYLQALDAAIEVNQAARNGMEPAIEALMSARETELGRLRQAAVDQYKALPQIDSLDTKDLVDSATSAFTTFAEAVPILTNEIDYTELNTAYKGAQEKHTAYLEALDAAIDEVNQAARNGMEPDIEALMSARETELGRLRQAAVDQYDALPKISNLNTKAAVDAAVSEYTEYKAPDEAETIESSVYEDLNKEFVNAKAHYQHYIGARDKLLQELKELDNIKSSILNNAVGARKKKIGDELLLLNNEMQGWEAAFDDLLALNFNAETQSKKELDELKGKFARAAQKTLIPVEDIVTSKPLSNAYQALALARDKAAQAVSSVGQELDNLSAKLNKNQSNQSKLLVGSYGDDYHKNIADVLQKLYDATKTQYDKVISELDGVDVQVDAFASVTPTDAQVQEQTEQCNAISGKAKDIHSQAEKHTNRDILPLLKDENKKFMRAQIAIDDAHNVYTAAKEKYNKTVFGYQIKEHPTGSLDNNTIYLKKADGNVYEYTAVDDAGTKYTGILDATTLKSPSSGLDFSELLNAPEDWLPVVVQKIEEKHPLFQRKQTQLVDDAKNAENELVVKIKSLKKEEADLNKLPAIQYFRSNTLIDKTKSLVGEEVFDSKVIERIKKYEADIVAALKRDPKADLEPLKFDLQKKLLNSYEPAKGAQLDSRDTVKGFNKQKPSSFLPGSQARTDKANVDLGKTIEEINKNIKDYIDKKTGVILANEEISQYHRTIANRRIMDEESKRALVAMNTAKEFISDAQKQFTGIMGKNQSTDISKDIENINAHCAKAARFCGVSDRACEVIDKPRVANYSRVIRAQQEVDGFKYIDRIVRKGEEKTDSNMTSDPNLTAAIHQQNDVFGVQSGYLDTEDYEATTILCPTAYSFNTNKNEIRVELEQINPNKVVDKTEWSNFLPHQLGNRLMASSADKEEYRKSVRDLGIAKEVAAMEMAAKLLVNYKPGDKITLGPPHADKEQTERVYAAILYLRNQAGYHKELKRSDINVVVFDFKAPSLQFDTSYINQHLPFSMNTMFKSPFATKSQGAAVNVTQNAKALCDALRTKGQEIDELKQKRQQSHQEGESPFLAPPEI